VIIFKKEKKKLKIPPKKRIDSPRSYSLKKKTSQKCIITDRIGIKMI